MEIVTFQNDSAGGTVFGRETVTLQPGISDFLSTSPLMSAAQPCKRYFFSELAAGYYSRKDFSSRRQICVLLSGEIELTSSSGDVKHFVAGDVILLEDVEYEPPGRAMRITSEHAARVLAVQID